MFREMRRKLQALSRERTEEILEHGTSGVLAVSGDDGYPYAVPLSYIYRGGRLFFHCAKEGHKLDALRECDKASFCVIGRDDIVLEKCTTLYTSAIAFGRVRELDDADKARRALELIAAKYCPDDEALRRREVEKYLGNVCMLELEIEHLSGKASKELTLH